MQLAEDQLDLVTAARSRRPGALRELALILDEQLAKEDSSLDGAVVAWRAVRAPRTHLGMLWAEAWAEMRGRRRGDSPSGWGDMSSAVQHGCRHAITALDRRPAA